VIFAAGEGAFSCCGVQLPPLEREEDDAAHEIVTERIEDDLFVSLRHPMEKTHYLSFFAYVSADRIQLVKLYPEQSAETRFPARGQGTLFAYCNRHGLYAKKI
jgi:desulfoferrodoxin (superoxide reductase-like protein)